jgi:hypothetical protein
LLFLSHLHIATKLKLSNEGAISKYVIIIIMNKEEMGIKKLYPSAEITR